MHQVKKFKTSQVSEAVQYFDEFGYAVFRDAFSVAQGNAFWADVEHHIANNQKLTYSLYGKIYQGTEVPLDGKKLPRIVDLIDHSKLAQDLALATPITTFLRALYGTAPVCLQTLTYKFSSEQGEHSDKTLVSPGYAFDYDRETLVASWIALESSNENNGALVIYPGSHKHKKRGFDEGFDDDYGRYMGYLKDWLKDSGFPPVTFMADRGDILFWHGDLVHAGGRIKGDLNGEVPTRKSLVCHYARIPKSTESRDPKWRKLPARDGEYFQHTDVGEFRQFRPALTDQVKSLWSRLLR